VTKLAEDRAEQYKRDPDAIAEELEARLRVDLKKTGDFPRIHPLPQSGQDVPDDLDARLVVLGIGHPYSRRAAAPPRSPPRRSSSPAAARRACSATPSCSSPPTRPGCRTWTRRRGGIWPGSRSSTSASRSTSTRTSCARPRSSSRAPTVPSPRASPRPTSGCWCRGSRTRRRRSPGRRCV